MVSSTNYNVAINPNVGSSIGVTNTMKVSQQAPKQKIIETVKKAKIKYRKIKHHEKYTVYGNWSPDYVEEVVKEIKTSHELSELRSRYKLITFKNPLSKSLYLKNCYIIEYIEAPQRYKGAGTIAVKSLLERALSETDVDGKIVVDAKIIDEKTSPAGFFYKLGFRFLDSNMNATMEAWVREKTLINAPKLTGMMYLPKENVARLLRYKENLL